MENHLIIVNIERTEPQTYVLFDDDNDRVVAVIEAEQCQDVTDRVALAIMEDGNYEKVLFTSVNGEYDFNIKADVTIDGDEVYEAEFSLIMTAKY